MNQEMEDRLLDLLSKQVSEGLTNDEKLELESLENTVESQIDLASLELTAAAIAMSPVRTSETLPDHLKSRILADADKYFSEQRASTQPAVRELAEESKPRMNLWGWLGWAAAAAACIALATNIYQTRISEQAKNITPTPTPIPQIQSPSEKRDQLLASSNDIVRTDWGPGNVAGLELAGDIVWSDAKQEGYMRFRNLPKNDVAKYTYQLWIFDETQDPKTPIDGGIFDIDADGEIVIPINSKLRARSVKAFAITMEKPGGVIVSSRKQVVSLAQVKPSSA